MIVLNVFFNTKPEFEKQFVKETKEMIRKVKNENGCIQYELYKSLSREYEYVLVEEWEDEISLEEHGKTPYFNEYINSTKKYLIGEQVIRKFD